jgi:NTP pyrophosphatase (non-canonical NTP hydrolase)
MTVITDLKILYEIDDSLWLEETIELLKAKRFEALDLDNLIEELEDLVY